MSDACNAGYCRFGGRLRRFRVRAWVMASLLGWSLSGGAAVVRADITTWDTGTVIPGTTGIVLSPTVQLDYLDLQSANLSNTNLSKADFQGANLTLADLTNTSLSTATFTNTSIENAIFSKTTSLGFKSSQLYATRNYLDRGLQGLVLTNNTLNSWDLRRQYLWEANFAASAARSMNLTQADLTDVNFTGTDLTGALLTDAKLDGANFTGDVALGLTRNQIYASASYKQLKMREVILDGNELANWDLRKQDMTGASFQNTRLNGSNFSQTNLTLADFRNATIVSAPMTDSIIVGANFTGATAKGLTTSIFYSTGSYRTLNLQGVVLANNNLQNWNLRQQNLRNAVLSGSQLNTVNFSSADLTNADLGGSTLTSAIFSGAQVSGANLAGAVAKGLTTSQFYSTASYAGKSIRGVALDNNQLTSWSFPSMDLRGATFNTSNLTSASFRLANLDWADLTGANLTRADFLNAQIIGADLTNVTSLGFTQSQLTSTASYVDKNLREVVLDGNTMTSWVFRDLDMGAASFRNATLTNADFRRANLTDADFGGATLGGANFTTALVQGAKLDNATSNGFTQSQLTSTLSYQNKDLTGISLNLNNMTGWVFRDQNLTESFMAGATLTNADLLRANLTEANLTGANLTNAVLTNAEVRWAALRGTVSKGFKASQLYSTASYVNRDLQGIDLGANDLTSWNFRDQNLTEAVFDGSTLAKTDFTRASLIEADLRGATLGTAIFTDAVVRGANFTGAVANGFTKTQLYSTGSYKNQNLRGMILAGNDLTAWDFRGQDLTEVDFTGSTLTDITLNNAIIAGADFTEAFYHGLTKQRFTSTASFVNKDLHEVILAKNDLTGWDFQNQSLIDADFSEAVLRNAKFNGAVVRGTDFQATTRRGFTSSQLYATSSYIAKNMQGIGLSENTLTGWNLANQNLAEASFADSNLISTTFTQSNVTGADFSRTTMRGFTSAQLYSTSSYINKQLGAIGLAENDLAGWNFNGQQMPESNFEHAWLTGATFTGAEIVGANFNQTTERGFTQAQLASTASYARRDLAGIRLMDNDLTGWNFASQYMVNGHFSTGTIWTAANLSGADLRGSTGFVIDWTANLDNTILPDGSVRGMNVGNAQTMIVRDYDGGLDDNDEPLPLLPVLVHQQMTFTPTAALEVVLFDNDWNSTMWVDSSAKINLDGTLKIAFGDASGPTTVDTSFDLFNWPSTFPTGDKFASVTWPLFTRWDLSDLYTTGEITLLSLLGSDLDRNGSIGNEDLVILLNNYTGPSAPNPPKAWYEGDADGDGDVDTSDLLVFMEEYDTANPVPASLSVVGAAPLAAQSVPEPSSVGLMLLGLGMLVGRQRRRS
ncbi:MAG: pentapeptide repeat-containing protein [Pirellulales bacterium]